MYHNVGHEINHNDRLAQNLFSGRMGGLLDCEGILEVVALLLRQLAVGRVSPLTVARHVAWGRPLNSAHDIVPFHEVEGLWTGRIRLTLGERPMGVIGR